jgi:hypothetical protein
MILLEGTKNKIFHFFLACIFLYFFHLMFLITLQYLPYNTDVAFLRIKQDAINHLHYRIAFFVHVYSSIFLLLFGWLQFYNPIRKKSPKIHRTIGYLYFGILLICSAPSGLLMSFYATGGLIGKSAFFILSILWTTFSFLALYFVYKKDFSKHRNFTIRSFALTLSAISLRLFKWVIVLLFHPHPSLSYQIVAWAGFLVNLLIAEWIIRRKKVSN